MFSRTVIAWPELRTPRIQLVAFLCLIAGYVLLGLVGLQLQSSQSGVTPVWPASGFAFAMAYWFGLGQLVALVPAMLVLAWFVGIPFEVALVSAVGSMLEAGLPVYLLRRLGVDARLAHLGGTEAHGDARLRKLESGTEQRAAHPVLALAHRRLRHADQVEDGQAPREKDLDRNGRCLGAVLRTAIKYRQAHAALHGQQDNCRETSAPNGSRLKPLLPFFELFEARFQRFEFLARSRKHGLLHLELIASDEIELG